MTSNLKIFFFFPFDKFLAFSTEAIPLHQTWGQKFCSTKFIFVSLDSWFGKVKAHAVISTTDCCHICYILLGVKQRKLVIYLWQATGVSPSGIWERLTKSHLHVSIFNDKLPSFYSLRKASIRDIKTAERLWRTLSLLSSMYLPRCNSPLFPFILPGIKL